MAHIFYYGMVGPTDFHVSLEITLCAKTLSTQTSQITLFFE